MEENISIATENLEIDKDTANADDMANELSGSEEVVPESTGSEETVEEKPEQKEEDEKEFESEEVNFEEGQYQIEGYNLDKYSEVLNFEDEGNMKIINEKMAELKKRGFTQEQADHFLESQIQLMEEYEADIKPQPVTRAEVMKVLTESLNREEKANYKPILSWTKEVGAEIGLTPAQINEAMSNPMLVKLMNGFYKKAANKGSVKTVEVKAPEPKALLGFDVAMKKVQEQIVKGTAREDIIKFAKGLESSVKESDLATYKDTFERIFGLK